MGRAEPNGSDWGGRAPGGLPGSWSSCRAVGSRKAGKVDKHMGTGEVSECQAERSGVQFFR